MSHSFIVGSIRLTSFRVALMLAQFLADYKSMSVPVVRATGSRMTVIRMVEPRA